MKDIKRLPKEDIEIIRKLPKEERMAARLALRKERGLEPLPWTSLEAKQSKVKAEKKAKKLAKKEAKEIQESK